MKTSDFKQLVVWQKAVALSKEVYLMVKKLPREETYALSDQMRRAVISIPSNIAEGQGRESKKEFLQFLAIARGSLCELETQCIVAVEIGVLQKDDTTIVLALCEEVGKMIKALANSISQQLTTNNSTTMIQQIEPQFDEVRGIIDHHRSKALREVNHELVLSAWEVGAYVSEHLKTAEWGSKTVTQLAEYLRKKDPTLRGYGRRNIYNMVEFYNCYTSPEFEAYMQRWPQLDKPYEGHLQFVQTATGQIVQPVGAQLPKEQNQFVQSLTAQIQTTENQGNIIVQSVIAQFRPIPEFLLKISFTNHVAIFNNCSRMDAKIFYILYANREHLSARALERAINSDAMAELLGDGHNLSKGLKDLYPQAGVMLKDTLMVDFLGLPKYHKEPRLHKSIIEHGKEFMAELGSDFLFMGSQYPLEVGGSTFKVDLLYFHRGLQCLVAIELKATPFKPTYMGQLEFYLEALDRDVRRSNENPSVGILLCQESNRTVVEYAMSRSLSPTMVAEYQRMLIPKEVVQKTLDEFVGFIADESADHKKGGKK